MPVPVAVDTNILFSALLKGESRFAEVLLRSEHWRTARELCRGVDESDTPHVALTLELQGRLWTGDRHLREGLAARGFDRFFSPEP